MGRLCVRIHMTVRSNRQRKQSYHCVMFVALCVDLTGVYGSVFVQFFGADRLVLGIKEPCLHLSRNLKRNTVTCSPWNVYVWNLSSTAWSASSSVTFIGWTLMSLHIKSFGMNVLWCNTQSCCFMLFSCKTGRWYSHLINLCWLIIK